MKLKSCEREIIYFSLIRKSKIFLLMKYISGKVIKVKDLFFHFLCDMWKY